MQSTGHQDDERCLKWILASAFCIDCMPVTASFLAFSCLGDITHSDSLSQYVGSTESLTRCDAPNRYHQDRALTATDFLPFPILVLVIGGPFKLEQRQTRTRR